MAILDGNSAERTATGETSASEGTTGDLFSAIERVELALARLEEVVARREAEAAAHRAQEASHAPGEGAAQAELSELKTRHRKLRERVTAELQQLDLLLSSLPQ